MNSISLADITDSDRTKAEQTLLDQIRTAYPYLDLREGTALRDLLIRPDAHIFSLFSKEAELQRDRSSLVSLIEGFNSGKGIDTDDLNRILTNFNMAGKLGTAAKGYVVVRVTDPRTYVVSEGSVFETITGLQFSADSTTTYSPGINSMRGPKGVYKADGYYCFIVPVTCLTAGSVGNIAKNTVLYFKSAFTGFISASAYADFSGGSDVEGIESLGNRIKAALSLRGLITKTSVEAVLRDRFDAGLNPIVDVSVAGFGDPVQIRDRHNPFGISVGGRADVYVRNFTAAPVTALTIECTFDSATGDYVTSIGPDDAPGMLCIDSVSDAGSDALASYDYSVSYGTDAVPDTWHDFDVSDKNGRELAGTVWRGCTLRIHNSGHTDETRTFNINVIALPDAAEIQATLDDDTVRNVAADYVARCPMLCRVFVNMSCRYRSGAGFDVDDAANAIVEYINGSGFVGRLTRSEIACILREKGATSVTLDDEHDLVGSIRDADGVSHGLVGDSLDLDSLLGQGILVSGKTAVFVTSRNKVNIVAIPE